MSPRAVEWGGYCAVPPRGPILSLRECAGHEPPRRGGGFESRPAIGNSISL